MPIDFISSPTEIRRHLRRLIGGAEEIELFVGVFDDADLAKQLVRARQQDVEVNITLTLDERTPADLLDQLIDSGVTVGVFAPREFKRRNIGAFRANVWLFDSTTEWRTSAIVGGFDPTTADLNDNLVAGTLLESDDFSRSSEVGTSLIKLLQWVDALNFKPLTETMRAEHRDAWEASQRLAKAAARQSEGAAASGGASYAIEVKFISPLSWQELRNCGWEDFFQGLLDAERQRPEASPRRISGETGWLSGIDEAQFAFREGPDRWNDPRVRDELVGAHAPSDCLGRIDHENVITLLDADEGFRTTLHEAIERCIIDPQPGTLRHALAPLLEREGVTVGVLSRFLAAAAPDRFASILHVNARLRLSDIVGFDVHGEGLDCAACLDRYIDAMEQVRNYPWASALSAERSTDHPDEADAWSKRAALLGCLVA